MELEGRTVSLIKIDPVKAQQRKAQEVRAERDRRLAETDWMALPDSPRCTPELLAYRQALRDVTDQPGFPRSITWPTRTST